MLLPQKAVEINTYVRRKFQKLPKFVYSALIALILLAAVYLLHKHHHRRWRESVQQKSATRNLYKNIRVFCLIIISQPSDLDAALKVHKTWAKHCNRALFVSSNTHDVLEPLIILEPKATSEHKWMRLRLALRYVYDNHLDEANWFLIANDHNFVILENLRKLLEPYSPDKPINFGCTMKDKENQTYMNGSYVVSSEALRRLVETSFTNSSICNQANSPYANAEIGRCLRNVGVIAGESRDDMGRQRFIPDSPREYIMDSLQRAERQRYTKRTYYQMNDNTGRISPGVISFSKVDSPQMVTLYFYIYKLRIFGKHARHDKTIDSNKGRHV